MNVLQKAMNADDVINLGNDQTCSLDVLGPMQQQIQGILIKHLKMLGAIDQSPREKGAWLTPPKAVQAAQKIAAEGYIDPHYIEAVAQIIDPFYGDELELMDQIQLLKAELETLEVNYRMQCQTRGVSING